jgi:SDR family mycofactocin-dependent oxidoreductase
MGLMDGRTALVTGAASGQGRSHAAALAREGCDLLLVDACAQISTVPYELPDAAELEATAKIVREQGRRATTAVADVRDVDAMRAAVAEGVDALGKIDFAVANAGIWSYGGMTHEISDEQWDEMIDVNLKGVWNTFRAVVPSMLEQGFGRIVATSSMVVRGGFGYIAHYNAAKAGVSLLVKTAAIEYADKGITVNAVLPTNVNTRMIRHDVMYRLMAGGGYGDPSGGAVERAVTVEDAYPGYSSIMSMGIPWVEPEDVSGAVVYLLSDAARYVTGTELAVNGGFNKGM